MFKVLFTRIQAYDFALKSGTGNYGLNDENDVG
jgi:hypothetical protein